MIFFASTLRSTRRPRRTPSVASVVRTLGTVRISDQPPSPFEARTTGAPMPHPYEDRRTHRDD